MNSEKAVVDGLGSGLFPNHPKTGDWFSLKGRMLEPWELEKMESTNEMNPRPQAQSSITQHWNETVVVQTGLTPGGGAMAK